MTQTTACPSGMATTFLAARRLEQTARQRGWRRRHPPVAAEPPGEQSHRHGGAEAAAELLQPLLQVF